MVMLSKVLSEKYEIYFRNEAKIKIEISCAFKLKRTSTIQNNHSKLTFFHLALKSTKLEQII